MRQRVHSHALARLEQNWIFGKPIRKAGFASKARKHNGPVHTYSRKEIRDFEKSQAITG